MDSSLFSLRNPWIVSCLIPIFTFICGNFSLFIITSFILGTSAFLFLTHSKNNIQVIEQEEESKCQEDEFDHMISDQKDSNQSENVENKGYLNVGSPDSSSESEIIDRVSCTTEEDSDFEQWRCSGETRRRADCSDGSISDEDSLIEIELYDGQYVGYKDEKEFKFCRRQKSPESVLCWAEMNEEENMIEIDLSVGQLRAQQLKLKHKL